MKDYKRIIKYLKKSDQLLSKQLEGNEWLDNIDLHHAKINLQFAIMDLSAIDREQDREMESMAHQYMEDMLGMDVRVALDKINIRGDK